MSPRHGLPDRLMRLLFAHIIFLIRGCQHPKMEPEGFYVIDVGGVAVTMYLDTCTVCGITMIHEIGETLERTSPHD